MVVNHFLDGDSSVTVDCQNQSHLPGESQGVLALSVPGQRMEIERSNLEQILESIRGNERVYSLHVAAPDVRAPRTDRVCGSLIPLAQTPGAELNFQVSPRG